MKTLFFVLAGFFSMIGFGHAGDEVPWHAVKRGDFASPVGARSSLAKLQKAIKVRASMATIVAKCGLPDAQIDPAKWPLPHTGIVMSGGIVWDDGFLVGEELFKRYCYDLPNEGHVIITTNGYQAVEYAILESIEGDFKGYLVGQPYAPRLEVQPYNPQIPHISKDMIK